MEKIAVLIPCYNEEKTIKKVVEDWKKELPEATIYVYNNNSTDRTVEIAKEAGGFDYILADLGDSTKQNDNPKRGFYFKVD